MRSDPSTWRLELNSNSIQSFKTNLISNISSTISQANVTNHESILNNIDNIILEDSDLIHLDNKLSNLEIYNKKLTKVFINGDWIGCCSNYSSFMNKYKNKRSYKIKTMHL